MSAERRYSTPVLLLIGLADALDDRLDRTLHFGGIARAARNLSRMLSLDALSCHGHQCEILRNMDVLRHAVVERLADHALHFGDHIVGSESCHRAARCRGERNRRVVRTVSKGVVGDESQVLNARGQRSHKVKDRHAVRTSAHHSVECAEFADLKRGVRIAAPLIHAYASAAYDAFNSFALSTHDMRFDSSIASSNGNA